MLAEHGRNLWVTQSMELVADKPDELAGLDDLRVSPVAQHFVGLATTEHGGMVNEFDERLLGHRFNLRSSPFIAITVPSLNRDAMRSS